MFFYIISNMIYFLIMNRFLNIFIQVFKINVVSFGTLINIRSVNFEMGFLKSNLTYVPYKTMFILVFKNEPTKLKKIIHVTSTGQFLRI